MTIEKRELRVTSESYLIKCGACHTEKIVRADAYRAIGAVMPSKCEKCADYVDHIVVSKILIVEDMGVVKEVEPSPQVQFFPPIRETGWEKKATLDSTDGKPAEKVEPLKIGKKV